MTVTVTVTLPDTPLLRSSSFTVKYAKNVRSSHDSACVRRKPLHRAGLHAGAYYLAGYAVECALKACIAKRVRRHDFPDRATVQSSWSHNLHDLIRVAELKAPLEAEIASNSHFFANWAIVTQWRETVRYDTVVAPDFASDILSAINLRTNGVLPWIVKRW